MKKSNTPSSPAVSHKRLSSGFSSLFYIPFFALFIFEALSGYYLFVHTGLDFHKYFIMRIHVYAGFAFFALFMGLSVVHLKRLYRWSIILATFLAAFSFYIMCALEAHPPTAFVVFVALSALLAWRYLLGSPGAHKLPILTGVAIWGLFNLIFASGLAMGGPMKSFRTDMFNTVHKIVAVYGTPFLFYHLLYRQELSFTWKKAAAYGAMFALNLYLFIPALSRAGWYQTHKVKKAPPSAYSVSVSPDTRYSFKNAQTCGSIGCHTEVHKQWKVSTHRFSAANLPYKKVVDLFVQEMGEKNRVFCERCHNPDVVIFAEESKNKDARAFFTHQGISCLSCHLISKVDAEKGNGLWEVEKDISYLPGFHPKTEKEWKLLHYFIRTDLRIHRANYQRRPFYQSPEICAGCHRQTISSEINGAQTFVFEGPYASWKKSVYAKRGVTCAHCHMQLFEFKDPQSIEREMHARPDHRTFGINASLPFYIGEGRKLVKSRELRAFSSGTRKWLNGTLWVSKYEQWFLRYVRDGRAVAFDDYFHRKPVLGIGIQAKEKAVPGRTLNLMIKTKNERVGHNFPVSLLDMAEVWLQVQVTDGDNRVVFQSGFLDENHYLSKEAHRLGAILLDKDGRPIDRHRIWRTASMINKRVIAPHEKVQDTFTFKLPSDAVTPLRVQTRWLYRRANQDFADWLFNHSGKTFPVIELSRMEKFIDIF